MSGKALKGKLQENLYFKIQFPLKKSDFFQDWYLLSDFSNILLESKEQNLSRKKTFEIQEEDEQCLPWEKRKVLLW